MTSALRVLSHAMRGFWTHFAEHGEPESEQQQWPVWQGGTSDNEYLVFETEQGGGLVTSNDVVVPAALVEAIVLDPRLPSLMEKCDVYASLVRENPALWSEKSYRSGKPMDCRVFPLQE